MKRRLSREEAVLWARVASTVAPLNPPRYGEGEHAQHDGGEQASGPVFSVPGTLARTPPPSLRDGPPPRTGEVRPASRALHTQTLDSTWDRRLSKGIVAPDFTLDLHGHSLDAAHARLDSGLAQAKAMGARLVLVITGRPRGAEAADRGQRRGAIRAKLLDWLAHSGHADDIAAVRTAHRRHGGAGAVYLVLRRRK